ncbi:uncharacterized protein C1orf50 homolog [Contarinia nasturtii]|uniref:uncharacterized protein C1orf50 homolog n=1 Tax=Contarinia nasturtii TaxID=265458 RepID=UPI0012D373DA|nr:uncharacterized protein C1orf50 homolog [Contarinia nasturtii]
MKRAATENLSNDDSIGMNSKQVNLVERNTTPLGYELLNPNYVGKHNAFDLISLASEIQNADIAVNNQSGKLTLILDQIRFLQSQAHQILRDIKTDVNLHQAACNFKKVAGKTYYLYQRESGQCYFSMLSPQEWGMKLLHKYLGGYRLELDQTWTPLDRIGDVDEKKKITKKLIQSSNFAESFRAIANTDDAMN